ncbi:MAG: hypothetical protein GY819_00305 [Planctomycetaceae bacterium]|nr:hypothetical protein [Planctomycetaceae bacterium]
MPRSIHKRYSDPLDLIWVRTAHNCGIQVVRSTQVFAAWDGKGKLQIGTPETLDPDDSLAQMILHELCHALVAGPQAFQEEDWGLDYDQQDHEVYEHAALRLQAALADTVHLRTFFASTTDFRDYFDRLPENPLDDSTDEATGLAIQAMQRLKGSSWDSPIREALMATAKISQLLTDFAGEDSIWRSAQTDALPSDAGT